MASSCYVLSTYPALSAAVIGWGKHNLSLPTNVLTKTNHQNTGRGQGLCGQNFRKILLIPPFMQFDYIC